MMTSAAAIEALLIWMTWGGGSPNDRELWRSVNESGADEMYGTLEQILARRLGRKNDRGGAERRRLTRPFFAAIAAVRLPLELQDGCGEMSDEGLRVWLKEL